MKKWIPLILVAAFASWIVADMQPPKPKDGYDLAAFGRLPVLLNGRIQPFDSVARNTLLSMSGKSAVRLEKGPSMSATEWLLEAMTRPDDAAKRKIFRTQHPDVESMLGTLGAKLEYYSLEDVAKHINEIHQQATNIFAMEEGREDATKLRTPFQKDLLHLYSSLELYQRLQVSLQPEGSEDFAHEVSVYHDKIPEGLAALQASEKGEKYEPADLEMLGAFFKRYTNIAAYAYPLVVPPTTDQPRDSWSNIGTSLMQTMRSGDIHPAMSHLAAISTAYTKKQPVEFNKAIADYRVWLQSNNLASELQKGREEFFFNHEEPFYKAMVIYVAALLLGCAFWMNLSGWMRKSAFALVIFAFVIHTGGLVFRMYLEHRPPVTNLYSSAIFVGWGAVLLGIILERIYKGGIGLVTAAAVGFSTQIIAHHLAQSGDTMEMLRAVLDTNFWLATHVVCITTGYASMFLAGFLAIVYILMGFFTNRLKKSFSDADAAADSAKPAGEPIAKVLSRMVYGIVCFATLFSFVGTVLGGIWADQSWGRFWGWDVKENGALLIVLWCAIWLHARWGGIAKERGLMAMAIFGNIVTSFSWFGVNMLGVGLHSYGFMDAAFYWLIMFIATQVVLIGMCCLPRQSWKSFRQESETAAGSNNSQPPSAVRAGA